MLCESPVIIKQCSHPVSCGHCPGCRNRLIRDWQLRMSHELAEYDYRALFVTLTYKNEEVPHGYSLSKRDVQLFIKRLRKYLSTKSVCAKYGIPYKTPIKYFIAGEYGPRTGRPHYHCIILGLDSRHRKIIFDAWGKSSYAYYDCKVINSNKALAYVAGYSSKKLGIRYSSLFTRRTGKIPPFQLVSLGFGKRFALRLPKGVTDTGTIRHGGSERLLPRYYRKILQIKPEVIGRAVETIIVKSARALTETFGINSRRADYEVRYNGSLMRRIRLEYNSRLRKQFNQWRGSVPALV